MKKCIEIVTKLLKVESIRVSSNVTSVELLRLILGYLASAIRGLFIIGLRKRGLFFCGRGSVFKFRSNIEIGRNVRVGKFVTCSGLGRKLTIDDGASIGDFSSLIVSTTLAAPKGEIYIGKNVGIGEFAYIGGAGGVKIGSDTISGQYLSIHPQNHSFPKDGNLVRLMPTFEKGITIGSNCWLGSKVTLLDGASVGNNCVVAAGAVVTGKFPANTLIGGVPAKVMRQL